MLAPMRPTSETTIRHGSGTWTDGARADRQAYLSRRDALATRADLTLGRWPAPQTVGPRPWCPTRPRASGDRSRRRGRARRGASASAASTTRAARGRRHVPAAGRPRVGARPAGGAGFSPSYSDGLEAAPPTARSWWTSRRSSPPDPRSSGLRVTTHPTLALAGDSSLQEAARPLDDAPGLLAGRVADRARMTRLASDLPRTLAHLHAQRASTASTVLVVLLLGTALSLAAALLTGRLVGGRPRGRAGPALAMGSGAASSSAPRPPRPRCSRSSPARSPCPLRRSCTRA